MENTVFYNLLSVRETTFLVERFLIPLVTFFEGINWADRVYFLIAKARSLTWYDRNARSNAMTICAPSSTRYFLLFSPELCRAQFCMFRIVRYLVKRMHLKRHWTRDQKMAGGSILRTAIILVSPFSGGPPCSMSPTWP